MKNCIACGMPMNEVSDFAQGDESKDYCKYCARPDGTMQSYEEKLHGMTHFIIRTQGFDPEAAQNTARALMADLPAWKA
ncbi:MAG: zinc ribbon domain-containing protein [Clostridia bacterium]|nr:zinc ribbon domain-containing protein [Clostridia bacterium]